MKSEELENRKCVITGLVKPKNALLRFTILPSNEFVPDFNKKLGGKGIYFSNSKSLIRNVVQTAKIGKLIHKPAKYDQNLPDLIEKLLAAKGLEALNLARKSGNLIFGFEKIKEQIIKNKVAFVVEATDAGADGKQKMFELCKNIEIVSIYDSATFDRAFDKEMVVYIAILKSESSANVYEHLKRYEDYLNG